MLQNKKITYGGMTMFKRTLSLLLCLLVAVPSLVFCAFA